MSAIFYTLIPAAALLFGYILGRAVSNFSRYFDDLEDEAEDLEEPINN